MFADDEGFSYESNEPWTTTLYDIWQEHQLPSSNAMNDEEDGNYFLLPSLNSRTNHSDDRFTSFSGTLPLGSDRLLEAAETTECVEHAEEERLTLDFEKSESSSNISNRNGEDIREIIFFSRDQISCICSTLIQSGDASKLHQFLRSVPEKLQTNDVRQSLARMRISEALNRRNFTELFFLIKNNRFDPSSHRLLQEIWYRGHYLEAEQVRGRTLGNVDKYRLRKKYPPPKTIWDGEKTEYCFRVGSRQILLDSYKWNRYPNLEEKRVLVTKTGLNITQINNWFKNRRQRDKQAPTPPTPTQPSSTVLTSPAVLTSSTVLTSPAVLTSSHSHRCPNDMSCMSCNQLQRGSHVTEWNGNASSPMMHLLQHPKHHSNDGFNSVNCSCTVTQSTRSPLAQLNQIKGREGSGGGSGGGGGGRQQYSLAASL